MIENKLLHFGTERDFDGVKNNIASSSIAFVDNPPMIYTHNVKYYCGEESIALITQRLADSLGNTKTELEGKIRTAIDEFGRSLSNVAFSGNYADLNNKPDIPSLTNYYDKQQIDNMIYNAVISATVDLSPLERRIAQLENNIITWQSSN